MIIHPLPYRSKVDRIPLAVMDSGGTIDGTLGGFCFADSPQPLLRLARRYGGTATIVKGRGSTRWLKFEIRGTVYIPGVPNPSLEEVEALSEFAGKRGVRMSSFPRVAFNLFRNTLPGYCEVAVGATMPRASFPPGARLHARPGYYEDAISIDVRSAYLWAIGTLRIPSMYSTGRARLSEIVDCPGGFALVRVKLRKEVPYGPIPCFSDEGTTAFPTRREGYSDPVLLSSYELELALTMGDVRVEKSWTANRFVSPFTSFYHLARELREECGEVGKQVANTLWGVFSTGSEVSVVTFKPNQNRYKVQRMPSREPLCFPVAASVISRVRAKVYQDAVSERTVHVHTDGIIATGSIGHIPMGLEPGDWRIVGRYPEVEVLAPGWYRYVKDGVEKFKVAGRAPGDSEATRRVFNHRRESWLQSLAAARAGKTVLPSIHRADTGTV